MLSGIPLFPLYFFITAVTAFFALLVVVLVIFLAIKYRDPTGSIPLELGWSIGPFFVSMVIFAWATIVFFHLT